MPGGGYTSFVSGAAQYQGGLMAGSVVPGPAMSDSNDGGNSVMTSGPPQYVHSLSTEDVSPQSLERYRPSAISQQKYQKVTDLTGTGQQNPWPSSFSGVKTNTRDSWHSGGNSHLMDSSYLMRILGRDSQWVESSDKVKFQCDCYKLQLVLCCAGRREGGLLQLPDWPGGHRAGQVLGRQGRLQGPPQPGGARPGLLGEYPDPVLTSVANSVTAGKHKHKHMYYSEVETFYFTNIFNVLEWRRF